MPARKSNRRRAGSAPPIPLSGPAHTRERAAFWRVSLRTMQAMKKRRLPVGDVAAMVRWFATLTAASQTKLTPSFRRRVTEVRLELDRSTSASGRASSPRAPGTALGGPPAPHGTGHSSHSDLPTDPDLAAFEADYASRTGQSTERDALAALKKETAFLLYKKDQCRARGDEAGVDDAINRLAKNESLVHDAALRAQKLGLELGDVLPAAEVDRIFRALAYWLLRATDELLADLCPRLAAASASGPLFREEVRAHLEPALLAARLLAPLVRAAQLDAGTALPRRCIAALRESLAATLDDGAAAFERLYATPVPAHGAALSEQRESNGPRPYWSEY